MIASQKAWRQEQSAKQSRIHSAAKEQRRKEHEIRLQDDAEYRQWFETLKSMADYCNRPCKPGRCRGELDGRHKKLSRLEFLILGYMAMHPSPYMLKREEILQKFYRISPRFDYRGYEFDSTRNGRGYSFLPEYKEWRNRYRKANVAISNSVKNLAKRGFIVDRWTATVTSKGLNFVRRFPYYPVGNNELMKKIWNFVHSSASNGQPVGANDTQPPIAQVNDASDSAIATQLPIAREEQLSPRPKGGSRRRSKVKSPPGQVHIDELPPEVREKIMKQIAQGNVA